VKRGGLQTYLRASLLESLGTPGHDGIRAGSQSMTAAWRRRVVLGSPGAGPTYFTVTVVASSSSWVNCVVRWVAKASGIRCMLRSLLPSLGAVVGQFSDSLLALQVGAERSDAFFRSASETML
jgi:hypothetical protein